MLGSDRTTGAVAGGAAPSKSPSPAIDLVRQVLAGNTRAVARLITLAENDSVAAVPYLKELYGATGRAFVIGVTGSPGAGKSTLVDCLAASYRDAGCKVGIIAVDPTSPFTGGAILGDRIRMQSRSVDTGTFIRSMATRGHLGGLARTTTDVVLILDAAGFDIVLIETVGVGQDEVEVVRAAHATLVLLVPGMGDDIQTMKAGIMEIGDVFVVNKADHPGTERIEAELRGLLSISSRPDGWQPAVVRTVASEGAGIEDCVRAIGAYRQFLNVSEHQRDRKLQIEKDRLVEIVRSRIAERIMREAGSAARIDRLARLIAERQLDPYTAAEELLAGGCGPGAGSGES